MNIKPGDSVVIKKACCFIDKDRVVEVLSVIDEHTILIEDGFAHRPVSKINVAKLKFK